MTTAAAAKSPTPVLLIDPTPAAGLAGGATLALQLNMTGFVKFRGSIFCNVAAASVTLLWKSKTGGTMATVTVPLAGAPNPANTYLWNEDVQGPYVDVIFVNGGAASTILRVVAEAFPST